MKINFPPDFKEFVELLEKNKVSYLIVGGYAVGYHGYPRFTGDLDIWLKVSEDNAEKIVTAVNQFGFGLLGLTIADFLLVSNIYEDLIKNKRASSRKKDQSDIENLEK